jgi:hypothetical protein
MEDLQDFDAYVEQLCEKFYAKDGLPSIPPDASSARVRWR